MRDVRAIVTERGAGCDGRCGVSAVQTVPTKTPAADGEVVWSWRRDPGATLARSIALTTGARKAASPGRVRISRKTIARGKPGCPGCTCQTRVHSSATLAHGGLRAQSAPGFPCALFSKRGTTRLQSSGEKHAVRTRAHVYPRHCEPPGRREAPPDDRLREAIQLCRSKESWIASVAEPVIGRAFARPVGSSQ
jgi:hypothetical protein